jgi:putative salt-induced outer membrane protein YdiY
MLRPFRFAAVSAAAIALLLASVPSASAAVIPGWYSSTDLSAIVATGNSDTLNVGATVNLRRQGLRSSWNTTASFTRNDVRDPQRLAIISGGNAVIEKGELSAKSEKLFANSAYEYRITERFFWNLGASGERDKFAGLNSRLTGFLGLGYLWQNTDGSSLVRLGGAGTYTAQDEVIDDPDTENQFAGVRGTLDVERRFGDRKQHAFTSNLIVDENLQDTDDLRANWQLGLAAGFTDRLALKVGAQLAFDNDPQLIDLPAVVALGGGVFRDATAADIAGVRNLIPLEGKIVTPARKTDATFTVSLVINFGPGGGASRPTP